MIIEDFNPDIVIGIKVSGNKQKPTEDYLVAQIESMVMGKTNYDLPPDKGILIDIELGDISVMAFHKYSEVISEASLVIYNYIDSIKKRVPRRVEYKELLERGKNFKKSLPELSFDQVIVQGLNEKQVEFVNRSIKYKQHVFGLEQLRNQYYKLVVDDKINWIYQRAVYYPDNGYFDLFLDIKSTSLFETYIGGNIFSDAINQGFAGIDYKYWDKTFITLKPMFIMDHFIVQF